jgi:hypothetical protein
MTTNRRGDEDWLDAAHPPGHDVRTEEGVDVEAPPQAPQAEKPAMSQPQPEKIPPGGGTKRG